MVIANVSDGDFVIAFNVPMDTSFATDPAGWTIQGENVGFSSWQDTQTMIATAAVAVVAGQPCNFPTDPALLTQTGATVADFTGATE
jgi:hypothetical protein